VIEGPKEWKMSLWILHYDSALGHSVLPKSELLTKQNMPLEEYQKCFSTFDGTSGINVLSKEKSRSV
jgi:hypothetical protein